MLDNVKYNNQVAFGTKLELGGTAEDVLLKSDIPQNPDGVPFDRLNKAKNLNKLRIQLNNDAFQKDKLVIYRSNNSQQKKVSLVLFRKRNDETSIQVELPNIPITNFFARFNDYLLELRGKMARKVATESNQREFETTLEKMYPTI